MFFSPFSRRAVPLLQFRLDRQYLDGLFLPCWEAAAVPGGFCQLSLVDKCS